MVVANPAYNNPGVVIIESVTNTNNLSKGCAVPERVRGDVAQLPVRAQRLAHPHRYLTRFSAAKVSLLRSFCLVSHLVHGDSAVVVADIGWVDLKIWMFCYPVPLER